MATPNTAYLDDIRRGIEAQIEELQAQGVRRRSWADEGAPAFPPPDWGDEQAVAEAVAPPPPEPEEPASYGAPPGAYPAAPAPSPPAAAAPAPLAQPGSWQQAPTSGALAKARSEKSRSEQENIVDKRRLQAKLENRMAFLVDLRQKLDSDPELFTFVDSMLTNQVKAAERRQRLYSASVTIFVSLASLIAGWLLSAVKPL